MRAVRASLFVALAVASLLVSSSSCAAELRATNAFFARRDAGNTAKDHDWVRPWRLGTLRASLHSGWPACDAVEQVSGYFDIPIIDYARPADAQPQQYKHYFFWAFAPRSGRRNASVVLWLNGGPGCSSSIGLLTELGPCLFAENASSSSSNGSAPAEPQRNPYAWNEDAVLVFVDQPAGVGFSYADDDGGAAADHNEDDVARDMHYFLRAFVDEFASLRDAPIILAGESYGGHYVPAIAARIVAEADAYRRVCVDHRGVIDDHRGCSDDRPLQLAGIMVGNGLTDPYVQFASYAELAYTYCAARLGAPCVTAADYRRMRAYEAVCRVFIAQCDAEADNGGDGDDDAKRTTSQRRRARARRELQMRAHNRGRDVGDDNDNATACEDATRWCGLVFDTYGATGRNPYDIRRMCDAGGLCYNYTAVDAFLNRGDVQAALGVPANTRWQQCSDAVYADFADDFYKDFSHDIPRLLAAGVRVMIYVGDADFICNWLGNEAWVEQLAWDGHDAFARAPYTVVHDTTANISSNGSSSSDRVVGLARVVATPQSPLHFSFVRVFDAGHMVPMDQPGAALTLLRAFMANTRLE